MYGHTLVNLNSNFLEYLIHSFNHLFHSSKTSFLFIKGIFFILLTVNKDALRYYLGLYS